MVAANGIYSLAVIGTVTGEMHVHTLHFRSTVDPDGLAMSEDAYMQGLIDSWQASCATSYRSCFNSAMSPVQNFRARKVCGSLPLPGGVDEAQAGGSTAGTGSGNEWTMGGLGSPVSAWLATVTTLRTAYAGRSYRGRYYLGGLVQQGILIDDYVGPGRVANEGAYAAALLATYVTPADVDSPYSLFVWSRTLSALPGSQCQTSGADVTTLTPRFKLATMKSRKPGSGL